MELKRFYDFFTNEEEMTFKTYLPIQLDATCNGFQHMALLSNETILFKELNLVKPKVQDEPKHFYNFLFHKLINLFRNKVQTGEISKEKQVMTDCYVLYEIGVT
jgi:DNA-directed RNA polymerase